MIYEPTVGQTQAQALKAAAIRDAAACEMILLSLPEKRQGRVAAWSGN